MVVLMLLWPTNDILEVCVNFFHQQIARDFPISTSPCNTIKMFQAENTVMIIN